VSGVAYTSNVRLERDATECRGTNLPHVELGPARAAASLVSKAKRLTETAGPLGFLASDA